MREQKRINTWLQAQILPILQKRETEYFTKHKIIFVSGFNYSVRCVYSDNRCCLSIRDCKDNKPQKELSYFCKEYLILKHLKKEIEAMFLENV